ncbi:MAG: RimK/LysX family protein [Candidatus Woesearchaeota archaeon]
MSEQNKIDDALKEKSIVGLIEPVVLKDTNGKEARIFAKVDTGADSSSLDINLATTLSLGPIITTKSIVSSHGRSLRPVVTLETEIGGKIVKENFTLYNRSHMKYKVLIGCSLLKKGFLVDPSKEKPVESAKQPSPEQQKRGNAQ